VEFARLSPPAVANPSDNLKNLFELPTIFYALMLCLHPWLPHVAALGGFLVFVMSLETLSFLVTTPACWVPPLGDVNHGFPFLSGPGRLVIKDAIMMGAALVVMADSAKVWLRKRGAPTLDSQ